MVSSAIWTQGLFLSILLIVSSSSIALFYCYSAKRFAPNQIPIFAATATLLTLIVMGYLIALSRIFVISFIPLFLFTFLTLWRFKGSIKNQVKTNLSTLLTLGIFSFPMYFFTPMTTAKPIHRDGVSIFLLSQELRNSKIIAYPIGLPSIENLFFYLNNLLFTLISMEPPLDISDLY